MGFEYGILVMRVILGLGLAAHGAQKLFGWFGGYGLAGTGRFFESIGFRPGRFFAALAGLGEFVGGLLIALGLLGAVGPMLIIAVMIVAIFAVHRRNGFFAQNNGFELPLIYAISAATYAFRGFGPDRARSGFRDLGHEPSVGRLGAPRPRHRRWTAQPGRPTFPGTAIAAVGDLRRRTPARLEESGSFERLSFFFVAR